MKEGKDHDCVVIFFRNSNEVEIIVLMEIEEVIVFVFDERPI